MKKNSTGQLLYSPSDLVRYLSSPFASWMDRYNLEHPGVVAPDERSAEEQLIAETGQAHEESVLSELKAAPAGVVEIRARSLAQAQEETLAAIEKAGGKVITPKHSIGEWGFMADFADPEGNVMGLWEKRASGK
jgi:hypothetical protein